MVMTILKTDDGRIGLHQELVSPTVYLDHWAVVQFANSELLADRFISALHAAQGTWVLSQINLSEFAAAKDVASAQKVEQLIERAFPNFYVFDTVDQADAIQQRDLEEPRPADAPERDWILIELANRSRGAGGKFSAKGVISDPVAGRHRLLPAFEHLKQTVARGIAVKRQELFATRPRSELVPTRVMDLQHAFFSELIAEPAAQEGQRVKENDATDLMHAFPACCLFDMVLLDKSWCNKVAVATKRIRDAGIEGHLASCYSPKMLDQFFADLEALGKRQQ